jgi:Ni,Fe-hydrogenase I small subunit
MDDKEEGISRSNAMTGHRNRPVQSGPPCLACHCTNCPSFQDIYVKELMDFGFQKIGKVFGKKFLGGIPPTLRRVKSQIPANTTLQRSS